MSLKLPQIVKVKLSSRNYRHLLDKGYDLPIRSVTKWTQKITHRDWCYDYGKTIEISAEDLPPQCKTLVTYICDCCGKELVIRNNEYNDGVIDGKRYCHPCFIRFFCSGENSKFYDPTIPLEERINGRKTHDNALFNYRVKERDNYTCQICGKRGGLLNAHHLDGYDWCIEKRFDETNGITLCNICHSNFHTIYGYGNNTKEQFEEWTGNIINCNENKIQLPSLPQVYCIEDDIIYDDVYKAAEKEEVTEHYMHRVLMKNLLSIHGKHYVYYNDFQSMTDSEINELLSKGYERKKDTRVLCYNTGIVYPTIKQAAQETIYSRISIAKCCKGQLKNVGGKYKDKSLWTVWKNLSDFESLPVEEQIQIAKDNVETLQKDSYLYSLLRDKDFIID